MNIGDYVKFKSDAWVITSNESIIFPYIDVETTYKIKDMCTGTVSGSMHKGLIPLVRLEHVLNPSTIGSKYECEWWFDVDDFIPALPKSISSFFD